MEDTLNNTDWKAFSESGKADSEIKIKISELIESYTVLSKDEVYKKNSTEFLATFKEKIVKDLRTLLDPHPHFTKKEIDYWERMFYNQLTERLELKLIKKAFCSITFDAYAIYKFIEALKSLIDELEIKIEENRLHISLMDPSRIALLEISITNNSFEFYEKGTVGLNLGDLKAILKCSPSDNSKTKIIFAKEQVFFSIQSQKFNSVIDRSLFNLDIEWETIPTDMLNSLVYPCTFKLQREQLEYLVKNSGIYSEIITIKCKLDQLEFLEEGQIGTNRIVWEKEDVPLIEFIPNKKEKPITSQIGSYSLSFFQINQDIAKFILEKKDSIQFFLKDDTPLKTKIALPKLGNASVIFYLAPRAIEADYDEGEYYDELDNENEENGSE